jgi:hypothetical protein
VQNDLTLAQSLVSQLQTEVVTGDFTEAQKTSVLLSRHATSAQVHANDPLWRAAELIPLAGENLKAVRIVANSINDIVQQVASPGITLISNLDLGSRDPVTGGFDLRPLAEAKTLVVSATTVFNDSLTELATINRSQTVGPVSRAVEQLETLLTKASAPLESAAKVLSIAPGVLGEDGKRTYLLAFLNNAETTALGGTAAALSVITADRGLVEISDQSSSADLTNRDPVDVAVDQSAIDLYTGYLVTHSNTATSRPDFPTAGEILKAHYQRDRGVDVDGVFSIDPLALSYILKATGPITLSSGDVLSSENAVSLLLNGIYFRWDSYVEPEKVDGFFAEAASAIFDRVLSGDFSIGEMASAISAGVDQGSIMAWFVDPNIQSLLDETPLQGTLPKSNDSQTVIGTYFRDISASKMDYYLQTKTSTSSDICSASNHPTFTSSATLFADITAADASDLPRYVMSGRWGAEKFATQVFIYGPVGATLDSVQIESRGIETVVNPSGDDLGRPVAAFDVYLRPGETSTVSATFSGAAGSYGPLEVRGTPMINTTESSARPGRGCPSSD